MAFLLLWKEKRFFHPRLIFVLRESVRAVACMRVCVCVHMCVRESVYVCQCTCVWVRGERPRESTSHRNKMCNLTKEKAEALPPFSTRSTPPPPPIPTPTLSGPSSWRRYLLRKRICVQPSAFLHFMWVFLIGKKRSMQFQLTHEKGWGGS